MKPLSCSQTALDGILHLYIFIVAHEYQLWICI